MRLLLPPLLPAFAALFSPALHAEVTLPPLISDHMVLQRPDATLWGNADPDEKVTAQLGSISASATADESGRWKVRLKGLTAADAGTLTIRGKNELHVKDVAVGEVWLGSGQSNMAWTVIQSNDGKKEAAAAGDPQLRFFRVRRANPEAPMETIHGRWEVCTPEVAGNWSAAAYYFSRQLRKTLDVPVGIIQSAVGGTPAQAWTPLEALQADPELKARFLDSWQAGLARYPKAQEKHAAALAQWEAASKEAAAAGKPAPRKPGLPLVRPDSPVAPAVLYNGMIHGLMNYTIQGALWYQGEANASTAASYEKLLAALIASWRMGWGLGDFPFLIVQLANRGMTYPQPVDSGWALVRDAQRRVAERVPRAALAVAMDIGDNGNLHPGNKQDVGLRLALAAEALVYGKPVVSSGPLFDHAVFKEGKATITFKPGTAAGLTTRDGGAIKGFAVAGEDRKFVWAQANIVEGKDLVPHLVLSSREVPQPVAVRYGWASHPEVNLVNGDGLPAACFRTDDWPQREAR